MDHWYIETNGRTTIANWLDTDFVTAIRIFVELTND